MDQHVKKEITEQLRRRGVDVLTAFEDSSDQLPDEQLLDRVAALGRVLFTQDIRFKALAENWQRQGRPFAGLAFGHQLGGSIGQYVSNLELIAKATEPADWVSYIEHLPF
jgi:hypothetical protein